jgi:anhydro-N-acetylmuramic acid kinase
VVQPITHGVCFIGVMSGTSLDGIDATLVCFDSTDTTTAPDPATPLAPQLLATQSLDIPVPLRQQLLALHTPTHDELHLSALAARDITRCYAETCAPLLVAAAAKGYRVAAIGCHGQTVRHRPESGYSLQLNQPALLAELTGHTVIADFRNRDIAAGGQGAPLVPAFHAACFQHPEQHRVIANLGGIANLTDLPALSSGDAVTGFDCGPGNMLLDAWMRRQSALPFDKDGKFAASGQVNAGLLEHLLQEPYFALSPPKSTGRDLFGEAWLESLPLTEIAAQDVQATFSALTAISLAQALLRDCSTSSKPDSLWLCGGGARNVDLVQRIEQALPGIHVGLTDQLGLPGAWIESMAFAWLARQTLLGLPGNLPQVTGAAGRRILGAIYPA